MNIGVVGYGIVSSIGCSPGEVYSSLREGRSGIGEMRFLRSVHKELPVGEVPVSDDGMKDLLGIPAGNEVGRTVLMGILAVRQSLSPLALERVAKNGARIALVSGTTVAGMDVTERHLLDKKDSSYEFIKRHDCGRSTREIADYFGCFSEVRTISTACSSAANAILTGAEMLRGGEADVVVAGGSEALSLFHLNGFNSLMILDRARCRPFDATRAGLNLGEGAAYIVLTSERFAKEQGLEPKAYLTGCGNACDAHHLTASSENGEGAYLSMSEALRTSGLKPSEISYVNAHGTGTPNNDASETEALKRVFGDNVPPFSSTKSYTGHTTSASGGIEAVISILAIEKGFIPGNLGWKQRMDGGLSPCMGENAVVENVLSNSFGFGGNDTSLIFSKHPVPVVSVPDGNFEIGVLAKVEVSTEEELAGIRNYVKPLEARRMGKLMKAALLSSLRALEEAGVECPDAVVAATEYGCLENTEALVKQMIAEGENALSPSLFMQSTHNTIAGNIAIKTGCHGYNTTYSQDKDSLSLAMADAERLIRTGRCRTVLVGLHDENSDLFAPYLDRAGLSHPAHVKSVSYLLCRK